MKDFIKINENDNVIVALKELTAGETILAGTQEVTARETIPAGHKMAIRDIATGAEVIKYGFRIGNAKENIAAGQWVHVHIPDGRRPGAHQNDSGGSGKSSECGRRSRARTGM